MTHHGCTAGWVHRYRRQFWIEPLERRLTLSDMGLAFDIGAPT
jgi:hypothetical protein